MSRLSLLGIVFAISIIFVIRVFSESNEELDPLLRRPWISTIRERENRSFHRIQSEIFSKPHFVVKSDSWGRAYKMKSSGEIEYLLDSAYRQEFPISNDTILPYYEALSLENSGFDREALHLLDGILFCYSLKNPSIEVNEWQAKTNLILNRIRNRNLDKKEFYTLNDPHGCYHENYLHLRSDSFHYQIKVPRDIKYVYSRDPEDVTRTSKEYNARFFRMIKILDEKKVRTWEDELLLSEIGEKNFRKDKSILFIGALLQNQPIFDKDNFYKIWDRMRGLQPSSKREWKYTRKEKSPGYELKISLVDEKGNVHPWIIREYYYWKSGRGIFLSFSYPSKESENMESYWLQIVSSLRVRE